MQNNILSLIETLQAQNQGNQPEALQVMLNSVILALANQQGTAQPLTQVNIPPAPKQIFESLKVMQQEVAQLGISKNASAMDKNQKELYKYRGIDAVYNLLAPLFAKHDIVVGVNCLSKEREAVQGKYNIQYQTLVTVEYTFTSAIDASCHKVTVFGEAFDNGDKGLAKALSMAFKYACFQVFCIPVCDDPDATVHEPRRNNEQNLNIQNQNLNQGGRYQQYSQNAYQQHQNNQGQQHEQYINQDEIQTLISTLESQGYKAQKLLSRYQIADFGQITKKQYIEVMRRFQQYMSQNSQTGNTYEHGNYS